MLYIHEDLANAVRIDKKIKDKRYAYERNGKNMILKLLDYFGYYFDRDTMEERVDKLIEFPLNRNPNDQHLEYKSHWRYYKVTAYLKMDPLQNFRRF